ncbi:MAG: hypothetical protein ACE5Q6_20905 [Dehalococcoidia bacterium]
MALHGEKHQDQHHTGILPRIAHDIVVAYDWLTGPAMSERERIRRELYESQHGKGGGVLL